MLKEMAFSTLLMVSSAAVAQTPAPMPPTVVAPQPPAGKVASNSPADLSAADKKFIEKVASANAAEIQAAQLAQQKASDSHVKDVAQQIITDHTEAGQKLTALAQQKGVKISGELAPADQKELDKFSSLDRKKFDRAYVKAEIKGHKEMLAVLKKESAGGKDADVKALAEQLTPTIQKHLDMLQAKS